jgi:hypothetical protein
MKTKGIFGVIIAGQAAHLSEPTRRFLRGLLVFMLALGSLIALSARGQTNYTGAVLCQYALTQPSLDRFPNPTYRTNNRVGTPNACIP